MRYILAAFLAVFSFQAQAQQYCADHDGILKFLERNHEEAPRAMGISNGGHVVEVLVSEEGTWTIIITRADGISCLVAAGESWENIKRAASGKPAA